MTASSTDARLLAAVAAVAIAAVAVYLYQRLVYFRLRQFAHLPQVKPSLLWGHMAAISAATNAVERDRATDSADEVFFSLLRSAGDPDVLLLDVRPLIWPMLVIRSHAVAEQLARQTKRMPYSTDKSPTMEYLSPVIGDKSIIFANGHKWKDLRKRFNPGFAPQHLMSLMPVIADKVKPLVKSLDDSARKGEAVLLRPLFTMVTLDIIGAVSANIELNTQASKEDQHPIVRRFLELISTYEHSSIPMPWWMEPRIRLKRWIIERRLDEQLRRVVIEQAEKGSSATKGPLDRSVLALSLGGDNTLLTNDTTAVLEIADQLKSFLFAGHDTTSNVLQWAIYEVFRHPRILSKLREEIDSVLGTDPDPDVVLEAFSTRTEETLRAMPYTNAVIKETLRRHPPAGSARYSPPGTDCRVTLSDGTSLCVDGMILFICHDLVMLDEKVYGPTTWDFIPERWLPKVVEGDESALVVEASGADVPASAFRPFERGPRNCIGQELGLLEMRVILPLLARTFDFIKVGAGAATLGEDAMPLVDARGKHISKTQPYNVRRGTAGPNDGMEMRVAFRGGSGR